MLRKTMIVLAKTATLTGGLTVVEFAHRSGRGHWGGFGGSGHMGGAVIGALFYLEWRFAAQGGVRSQPAKAPVAAP